MSNEQKPLPPGTLIIRSPRNAERPYFASARAAAQDESISYESGGLLWYLLSKPDDWEVRISDLQKKGAGRDKVYSILKELKEAGYITRDCTRTPDGRFVWGDYQVHETPNPLTEKPDTVKPDTGKPDRAKPEINTKNRGKQKKESNKEKNPDSGAEAASPLIPLIIEVWVTGWAGVVSGKPYANKTYRADSEKIANMASLEDIKRYTLALKQPGKKWANARPSWSIWVNDLGTWLQNNPASPAPSAGANNQPSASDLERSRLIAENNRKRKESGNEST